MSSESRPHESLVVGEATALCSGRVLEAPPPRERAGPWRDARAFEVHNVLREVRAAAHLIDVCLGRLVRLMAEVSGYRRWGTRDLATYVTEDLRQKSVRRFQYLVAVDRAITQKPLPKLAEAWRRGEVTISQARELIRVMTPDNEDEWLAAAASMSVEQLRRRVKEQRAARVEPGGNDPIGEETAGDPWRLKIFSATRPVDAAWQVCLETSRRMAGFDLPVHECVDDLLAEYAAGCPVTPGDAVRSGLSSLGAGETAEQDAHAWRHTLSFTREARDTLARLRKTERLVRLAADPLEGLDGEGSPDAADLHRRIRWLLRVENNVTWHECRLMGLMADLRLYQRLGFSSLRRYAVEMLGSGERAPWAIVALARAVTQLPKVEDAFRQGEIGSLEAMEICKVATGHTQNDWIKRARSSTLRQLREDVAFVMDVEQAPDLPPCRPLRPGVEPCAEPAAERNWVGSGGAASSEASRLQTCAPRTSRVIATPLSSRVDGWYSAFGADVRAVAEAMLADRGRKRPVAFCAPDRICFQWDLSLAHCRRSLAGQARDAEAACFTDSQCVALLLLNFLEQWAHPEIIKRSRAYKVFTRDGWRCQVPRCRSRSHLHAHHVIYRSRNGPDVRWNLLTVCREHHEMIHAGVIQVRGRAPTRLEWAMGVDACGRVRERFINGTRVAFDARWSSQGREPRTISTLDWRAACDAVS